MQRVMFNGETISTARYMHDDVTPKYVREAARSCEMRKALTRTDNTRGMLQVEDYKTHSESIHILGFNRNST